ncbi:hypothetical protein NARC_150031 [Candidatus Nitrosocosmicus arcticus]|uniref:Uncharacterized protein n=1 Tax=Candidatus Nitrosocosmicus arcticus TaxID=2035267 RepID=A0A557SS51_9ARCH|nr:hypothetical protein NARC_150031 [Candidatus Nitrosocosmicus arcticus]
MHKADVALFSHDPRWFSRANPVIVIMSQLSKKNLNKFENLSKRINIMTENQCI